MEKIKKKLNKEIMSSKEIFGFWIYIMSDCVLFSTLFAVYIILHKNTFGGENIQNISNLSYVFCETIVLLTSSFTFGMTMISMYKNSYNKIKTIFWLTMTFIFGLIFISMEINEFYQLFLEGNTWEKSAFLSAFFTLLGTHGLHVTIGLIWILVMIIMIYTKNMCFMLEKKMICLSLFWHFLDIIWIFIFTIVYLLGYIE